MAGRTDNRGYIYPECDPPLVKDRSDIDYLRQLAAQVNADANIMEFGLQEFLEQPDAARILYTGTVTTSGAAAGFTFLVPYDTVTYDNTTGSTDLASNALRPAELGWYLIVSTVRCTNGGEQGTSVRHLRNGNEEGRRFEGPSLPISATEENMNAVDLMRCEVGDVVQTQVRQEGAAGTFTFECRLTMLQVQKLDV
jgi:hypothetical protein